MTKRDASIFGKNSDREPNEPQVVEYYPRRNPSSSVKCTYIEITPPTIAGSYSVLISRPFWMFGAEMGVNECGVSIGNEALFTKTRKYSNIKALLGMDMLRLALEQGKDAKTALDVITNLLDKYGQGGSNSFQTEYFYDNSFLIADRDSAWVLETAEKFWVAKEVRDFYSISNIITIHTDYYLASSDLQNEARRRGFWPSSSNVDFAKAFQDTLYSRLGKGSRRLEATRSLIHDDAERFDESAAKRLLRTHNTTHHIPTGGNSGDVCMHAGGLLSPDQTAGSMINTFLDGRLVSYVTGSSLPCRSAFKPHVVGGDDFVPYTSASRYFDKDSFWWRLERLHRAGMPEGDALTSLLDLEHEFDSSFRTLLNSKPRSEDVISFTKNCYGEEISQVVECESDSEMPKKTYWKKQNAIAHVTSNEAGQIPANLY